MTETMTLEQVRDKIASWYGGSQACLDVNACAELGVMIESLDAIIAARGEAVATVHETLNGNFWIEWHRQPMTHYVEQPLYTSPPAPQVDEAMVERASEASWPIAKSSMESTDWNEIGGPRREHHKRVVRAALQAVLENRNG